MTVSEVSMMIKECSGIVDINKHSDQKVIQNEKGHFTIASGNLSLGSVVFTQNGMLVTRSRCTSEQFGKEWLPVDSNTTYEFLLKGNKLTRVIKEEQMVNGVKPHFGNKPKKDIYILRNASSLFTNLENTLSRQATSRR